MLVVAVTLGPHVRELYGVISAPLARVVGAWMAENLLNAVLFVPLGAAAGFLRSRRGLAAVVLLAVAIEILQGVVLRDPALRDLLAYATGAVLGYVLGTRTAARDDGSGR